GVFAPSVITPVYSLASAWNSSIRLVNLPVQITSKPVARGSSVPACPTLSLSGFRLRLILLTTSKLVQRNGLSTKSTSPAAKLYSSIFLFFCIITSQHPIQQLSSASTRQSGGSAHLIGAR